MNDRDRRRAECVENFMHSFMFEIGDGEPETWDQARRALIRDNPAPDLASLCIGLASLAHAYFMQSVSCTCFVEDDRA